MAQREQNFDIEGMSCAACVRRVEQRVSGLEGVEYVAVNLATERMGVRFDPVMVDEEGIVAVVTKAGYGARLREVEEVVLGVGGMSCAACARRIERYLQKVDGVRSARVNLGTEEAWIEYEEVRLRDLRQAVIAAGYEVLPGQEGGVGVRQDRRQTELAGQLRVFRWVLLFWLPIFGVEMAGMSGWPVETMFSARFNRLHMGVWQLLMTVPVLWVGRRIYIDGGRALLGGGPNMFSLVAIGTAAAFVYSASGLVAVIAGAVPSFDSYFPAVSTIIALLLLGRYLEARSRFRAGEAMGTLLQIRPEKAALIEGESEREIAADEVELGDLLRVRPGERIPADGAVVEGVSTVDESLLTGEAEPQAKAPGDGVTGGSLNGAGALVIEAERVGRDAVLMQMMRLVEEAQAGKAPIARLADVVSGYFVPAVLVIGCVAAGGWLLAGESLAFALQVFVAVLIIACPCSLGLATPAAIMVGTGRGAQLGILVKSPEALEAAHKLDVVILDKTGTITEGRPFFVAMSALNGHGEDDVLRYAAAVEKGSEHPLSMAVLTRAKECGIEVPHAEAFEALPGKGARAVVGGMVVAVGNSAMMTAAGIDLKDGGLLSPDAVGGTIVWVSIDGVLAGYLVLADRIRPDSRIDVAQLRARGLDVVMLTGDRRAVAEKVAHEVGIETVYAEVLPGDKAAVVQSLQQEDTRVAMVGDGINDAPALATADVGIAVATGTDVAVESADLVLVHNRLIDVVRSIELSQAVMRTIRQNLFWAFFYNAAGIPVAAGVLYLFGGPLLNPILASFAMAFSSVSVVANALRLRSFSPHSERSMGNESS